MHAIHTNTQIILYTCMSACDEEHKELTNQRLSEASLMGGVIWSTKVRLGHLRHGGAGLCISCLCCRSYTLFHHCLKQLYQEA